MLSCFVTLSRKHLFFVGKLSSFPDVCFTSEIWSGGSRDDCYPCLQFLSFLFIFPNAFFKVLRLTVSAFLTVILAGAALSCYFKNAGAKLFFCFKSNAFCNSLMLLMWVVQEFRMGPTRKSRTVNKRHSYVNEVSPVKDAENAKSNNPRVSFTLIMSALILRLTSLILKHNLV